MNFMYELTVELISVLLVFKSTCILKFNINLSYLVHLELRCGYFWTLKLCCFVKAKSLEHPDVITLDCNILKNIPKYTPLAGKAIQLNNVCI